MIMLRLLTDADILDFDEQPAAVGHGVTRVQTQIHQNLLDLAWVGPDDAKVVSQIHLNLDSLADDIAQQADFFAGQLIQVCIAGLQQLAARKCQQLAGERGGAIGLRAYFKEFVL